MGPSLLYLSVATCETFHHVQRQNPTSPQAYPPQQGYLHKVQESLNLLSLDKGKERIAMPFNEEETHVQNL